MENKNILAEAELIEEGSSLLKVSLFLSEEVPDLLPIGNLRACLLLMYFKGLDGIIPNPGKSTIIRLLPRVWT